MGEGTGNLSKHVCLQADQVAGPSAHAENGVFLYEAYSRENRNVKN